MSNSTNNFYTCVWFPNKNENLWEYYSISIFLECFECGSCTHVTSSTDCYVAIIWKRLDNRDVKEPGKQFFTWPCRWMMSIQVVALSTTNNSSQYINVWKMCCIKNVLNLLFCFQGKPPPTSFASDPDPGDESYNNKKTVTRTTSNQYSEGRFCNLFMNIITAMICFI